MRILLLTILTMLAFAANSVLNRMAIVDGGMDAILFAVVRLAAGALALAALVAWQRRGFRIGGTNRLLGVASLLIYLFGFSLAYQSLDAGVGALLLFGTVQITMFMSAVLAKEAIPSNRWAGAALAFAGLVWLLWPAQDTALSVPHMTAMIFAGFGWGVYSLVGRHESDATQATAMNFILAVPFGVMALGFLTTDTQAYTGTGVFLAVVSGVVTSGLGYALWYAVLPALGASRAAVAQLTVPIIATAGGLIFLDEPITFKFAIAALLVLGGVWLSLRRA